MISVFDFCSRKWSESIVVPHREALSSIMLLTLPTDMAHLTKVDKNKTIIVRNNASVFTMIQLLKMGFSHCLDASQPDFDREVLVSSLMIINPKILVEHKIPFFLKGLNSETALLQNDMTVVSVPDRASVNSALQHLSDFIKNFHAGFSLTEVALFAADELMSNAIKAHEKSELKHLPVNLFAGFEKANFIVGCTDFAGSLDRQDMLQKLLSEFGSDQIAPLESGDGAGIGLRLVYESASSLYIHSIPGVSTIFCFGFKSKSLKSNEVSAKHIHFQVNPGTEIKVENKIT